MENNKTNVLQALEHLNIPYDLTEHPAVYTIDEMRDLNLFELGTVCKNLFLRDQKGKKHFLVVASPDKKTNLKEIEEVLESGKLSFASEERLLKFLGVSTGAVSPLAVINNDKSVTLVIDKDLDSTKKLGVHPNDNTATVWLTYEDLLKFIEHHGNTITFL